MSWTIADQCDAQAIALRARIDAGDEESKAAYLRILQTDFPSYCGLELKVRPKGGGHVVPFLFNQVQRYMWGIICDHLTALIPLFIVILKFRQAGMSTFWAAWLFWQIWRQGDVNAMLVVQNEDTGDLMVQTFRVFYDELSDWIKPTLPGGNSSGTIPADGPHFASNRSSCVFHYADNKKKPRGGQTTHIVETEHAEYLDADALNNALLPQLPPRGSAARMRCSFVIEGTPKGRNAFYYEYVNGKKPDAMMKSYFFPWFIFEEQFSLTMPATAKLTNNEKEIQRHLSRKRKEHWDGLPVTNDQMYWRRLEIRDTFKGKADVFEQEYASDDELCFLIASKSVFRPFMEALEHQTRVADERAIEAWKAKGYTVTGAVRGRFDFEFADDKQESIDPLSVKFNDHPHGQWTVWEPYIPGHVYVVGGDPGSGVEDGDNCVIEVLDVTAARFVAEYEARIAPKKFAYEMACAGYHYGTSLLNPERNTYGIEVVRVLQWEIGYPNLARVLMPGDMLARGNKYGFYTTNETKHLMISSFVNWVEDELVQIHSRALLSEMTTYEQRDGNKFSAQKGRQDGRVMACGFCIEGVKQTPRLSEVFLSASRIPSAFDLGISAVGEVKGPTPVPKPLKEFLDTKTQIRLPHWNPMNTGAPF